jgi:putrescine transport system substrate-binding protein
MSQLLVAVLLVAGLCLAACTKKPSENAAPGSEEKVLLIYNWVDFIGKSTVADFERETGIRVVYDTFDADVTLEAKLMAGDSGYDVVATAQDFFSRQIKAGAYERLDHRLLTNWSNLDPKALQALTQADPGNAYAVPYLNSLNGFAYNADLIRARMPDAPVDSLRMLFDPVVVSKFADCGVSFLDSAEDVVQLALVYLGRDPNSRDPKDLKDVEKLIAKVRPYIRNFDSSEFLVAMANKELCIAMSWASDYATIKARARAAGIAINLAFTVPKEGSNAAFTCFLIPAGAPHPENAHRFLNFILRPRVIAKITNEIHYPNPNLASAPFIDAAIVNDPALYPPPSILSHTFLATEVSVEDERRRTRTWTRIKTNH